MQKLWEVMMKGCTDSSVSDDDVIAEYLAFANHLADVAGNAIRPWFRAHGEVTDKGHAGFDPVTQADRAAEAAMRALIEERYPDHGIIGEEGGRKEADSDFAWVLDPIDGTRAFIAGLPTWGTLIAFSRGGVPLIGIMEQPYIGERFIGKPGGTVFRGRDSTVELATRVCPELSGAVLSTTHPWAHFSTLEAKAFRKLADQAQLTRFGGDCYAYCLLAHGLIDAVVEAGLQVYDVQALIPIIEGAGGVISTWSGGSAHAGGRIVAAGDSALHAQLVAQLAGVPEEG